jgi:hypothetical protein
MIPSDANTAVAKSGFLPNPKTPLKEQFHEVARYYGPKLRVGRPSSCGGSARLNFKPHYLRRARYAEGI